MYKIQQGTEDLNSNGGIVLTGALLGNLKSLGRIDLVKMGELRTAAFSEVPRDC